LLKLHKNERLLNEVCEFGKLENFREILKFYLKEIFKNNFTISCKYNDDQSSIDWTKKHIWVSLKKAPLKIIWDILHEYGHLLSEEKKDNIIDINRELKAWLNAEVELKKHSKLILHINEFNDYRNECLKTYQS